MLLRGCLHRLFDDTGQLGDGTLAPQQVAEPALLSNVKTLAIGKNHALAILGDGTVMAWGENSDGESGNGTTTDASRRRWPFPVLPAPSVSGW